MGMFDSFMVEIEDKTIELQTKHFDSVLEHYRVGDVVGGAPGGVRVYLDTVGLDAEGKHVWRDEEMAKRWTVLLVLAHGVFADYEVEAGALDTETALRRIRELQEKWEDSARLLNRLILALSEKQARVDDLRGRICHARGAIAEARRLRAGDDDKDRRFRFHEYIKRLDQGDDPLDVVEWTLSEEQSKLFVRSGPNEGNPLEPYLL
ncbi:MAG: hypothetical protein GY862_12965 [Gammaproteobacteria bacterium]|nr:hypothetical protein [Gammaproteobacteria bacterium]